MQIKEIKEIKMSPKDVEEAIKFYLSRNHNVEIDMITFHTDYPRSNSFQDSDYREFSGATCTRTVEVKKDENKRLML